MVLLLAQSQRLDDRPPGGNSRRRTIGASCGRVGQRRRGRARARRSCACPSRRRFRYRHCTARQSYFPQSQPGICVVGGFLRTWRGEPENAIVHFERAMRLSPVDPELYRMQAGIAMAHLFAGRFDAASAWAEEAYIKLPSFLMTVSIVASSRALTGRLKEARRA